MFNVGDMVKSNKLGIGTVVKSGRIFSTVNFNGKNKLVSNGSLTKYEEEPKKTEIKQEDIKGEQLSLFGAEADILEESNEEKEQEEIAEIITAANDSKVIKEEKKADIKQEKKEETKTVDVPVSNDEVKQKKPYTTIGKEFNKAINQNLWVKIKYKNKDGQETSFMIGPKDINPNTRFITVDSFNISYSVDVSERNILFNSILSAEAMEGTYHKTPDALINKIASNPEYYSFLLYEVSDEKVLDYYTECFKLDNVSYKTEYGLLREIDDNVLLENNEYKLTNDQFIILSKALFSLLLNNALLKIMN